MPFLDALGAGLRGAGAVLSPDVYQQQNIERQKLQDDMRRKQEFLLQMATGAVQNGSADPAILAQFGIQPGMIGPSLEAQQKKSQLDADAQFRQWLQGDDNAQAGLGAGTGLRSIPPQFMNSPQAQDYLSTLTKIAELKRKEDPFAKINPKDFTPESIAKFDQTRNRSDLVPARTDVWSDPYKLNGAMVQKNKETGEIRTAVTREPRVNVTVPSNYSDDAIDMLATAYARGDTKALANLGWGKSSQPLKDKVIERAAQILKNQGGDLSSIRASRASNQAALIQLDKQKTMVGAFEKNFNKNADIALQLSDKVGRTGVPVINRWLVAGKRNIAGDPDISAFDLSVKATVNEYTKIISGSMGNTVMAESEIKKVEGLFSAAQTPEQVKAVISLMKRETQNRMAGFEEQRAQLMGDIKNQSDAKPSTGKVVDFSSLK